MGMEFSKSKTPSGRPLLLVKTSGQVGAEDAARMMTLISTGGEYHGMPMLSFVTNDSTFSVEARRAFAEMGDQPGNTPTAVVMNSAPLRLVITFIVKASNLKRQSPTNLKFFSAEPDAMKWIDEEMVKLEST